MSRKIKIFSSIILLIILGGIAAYFLLRQDVEKEVLRRLENQPQLMEKYEKIKSLEAKMDDQGTLLSLGLEWKSLAELTKDAFFYKKALEMYDIGVQKFGNKNILFYWNAGKIVESLGNYDLAESYYKEAIRIAPAYGESYLYLADLYQYKLKKAPEEVLKIYDGGLKDTNGSAQLFLDRASFLRRSGLFEQALESYKILVEQYPTNQGYKDVVKELEEKIKK